MWMMADYIRKQKLVVKVGVIHKMKQSFGKCLHQAYNNKKEHSQNTSNTIITNKFHKKT